LGAVSSRATERNAVVGGIVGALKSILPYRRLWYSGLGYYSAYWVEIITTGWVVLAMTGSAFDVGLVGFCRTLPMLLLGLTLGAVSDRIRRSTLLLCVQFSGLVVSTSLTFLFHIDRANLAALCCGSALIGCGWAADFTTRRALVSEMNRPELTGNAMSLEAMSMQGSKIVATIVAGALLAAGGATLAYGVLAGIYAYGVLAMLRVRRVYREDEARRGQTVPLIHLIRQGLSTAVRIPLIQAVLLVTVVMNLLVFPYQQIIAVVARQILDVGPRPMGILAGADGIGAIAVAGTLVFLARPSKAGRLFLGGAFFGTFMVVAIGISRLFPLSLCFQILAGGFFGAFGSMQPVLIINSVEPQFRARALGVLAMAIGCTPLGILLSGTLSATIGATAALVGMGTLALLLIISITIANRSLIRASVAAVLAVSAAAD
jgi:MFS family permease